MQTRSKSGIKKPRLNPTVLLTVAEPTSVKQALSSAHWKLAMQVVDALIAHKTWSLVPLPLIVLQFGANGCFASRKILMVVLTSTRHGW